MAIELTFGGKLRSSMEIKPLGIKPGGGKTPKNKFDDFPNKIPIINSHLGLESIGSSPCMKCIITIYK